MKSGVSAPIHGEKPRPLELLGLVGFSSLEIKIFPVGVHRAFWSFGGESPWAAFVQCGQDRS